MSLVYTLSWEGDRGDSYDSREFSQIATVISTNGTVIDPVNVITATHQTSGLALPKVGDQSALDSRYFVQAVRPRIVGPHYAEIGISYRLGRGSGEQENENPLDNPVRYRVRNGVSSEATDADVNGMPLLNSAGDPFNGTVQANIAAIYIDIIRNEAAYNLPQAIAFTNKVNADLITLAGYPVQPGEAYCLGIQPDGEYTLGDSYVPVVYSFEVRERLELAGGARVTAFIHRLLDQGKRGWAYIAEGTDPGIADICPKNSEDDLPNAVSNDVLLNGSGIPLERDSYITPNPNFDDAAGRGWQPQDGLNDKAPNALARDTVAPTGATFLLYEKHKAVNFSTLGLP